MVTDKVVLIPFDVDGNIIQHCPKNYTWMSPNWIKNFEFEDTLIFKEYLNSNNSFSFVFVRESTLTTVSFTQSNFPIKKIVDGKLKGKFTFSKIGASFSCVML